MSGQQLPVELMKSLLKPEDFAAWERQQEASREFWRTLQGPAQRPLGSNADEWHLFLSEHKDALPFVAVQIAEALDALARQVYVPGLWRCPKCEFQLVQANLNARDGSVTCRDQPGDKCPNCNSPLWRVSERQAGNDMVRRCEASVVEAAALRDLLTRCAPAVERCWGLLPGGPKKSQTLVLLNDIRKAVPACVDG